jgi:AcrR family transcriptional regulator
MSKSKTPGPLPRKRHPRGTAQTSRQELVSAAIKILKDEGITSLTTSSITKAAGFTQSAFYQHFENVDDCLQEVAGRIATQIRSLVDANRKAAHEPTVGWESLTAHFRSMLELFQQERTFCELFLRHRRDRSPLGKVMKRLYRDLQKDLTEHLLIATTALGTEVPPERLALHAELILAQVFVCGEGVIDRRNSPDELASELTLVATAAVHAMAASTLPNFGLSPPTIPTFPPIAKGNK